MSYEVSQVVGEADEEDENIEKTPDVQLEFTLENYKSVETAQLHLFAHTLVQEQKNMLKKKTIELPGLDKVEAYLEKVKNMQKKKKNLEKRANAVKSRLDKVLGVLSSK